MTRPDDALRPTEVARITGVSPSQLREYRIRYDGPSYWLTPGGQARYRRGDVERWIRERTVETTGR